MKKERNDKFIYIVTRGEFGESDYCICEVFEKKKDAEFFANFIKGTQVRIGKYKLNPDIGILRHKTVYSVCLDKKGNVVEIEDDTGTPYFDVCFQFAKEGRWLFGTGKSTVNFYILAENDKKAIEIANEKRIQLIANGIWKGGDNESKRI